MQILLGVQETIIRINSESIKIDFIQNFIDLHFTNRIIKDNMIFIPQAIDNNYHRKFLLKWLYALYTKKTNKFFPQLKELLLKRQNKPIKIFLKKSTTYKITYSALNKYTICIKIIPFDHQIFLTIKQYFFNQLLVKGLSLHVKIQNDKEKQLLKNLLNSTKVIKTSHKDIYNKDDIDNLLKSEEKFILSPYDKNLQNAHKVLGSSPYDDTTSLKKRYKKLAQQFHPDKYSTKNNEIIKLYTEKFQKILHAYTILSA